MTFYILGASGFLGKGCAEYLENEGHTVVTERIDVKDFSALKKRFLETKPEVVINFAGVRAYPNIDWHEDNKEETIQVNVSGAVNAMTAALEAGAYPIQISSGCVYSGGIEKAFTEDDEPNFYGSFYSRMRIVMQNILKELPVLQIRIRMPVSKRSHPRNFIDKIVSYKKVISVPNSVTLIEDLYPAILKLSLIKPVGILNLTNDGYVEHKDFLEAYRDIVDSQHRFTLISPEELVGAITKTGRSNCVLDNSKAKKLGLSLPGLGKHNLKEMMKEFKASKSL